MKHTTVLFDLDGTITDSGAGVMHGMEIALAHYGLPIPDRQALRVIIGPPLRDSFIRFGIRPDRAVNFECDSKGTQLNYNVISQAVCKVRSCSEPAQMSMALGDDWKKEIEADYLKRHR